MALKWVGRGKDAYSLLCLAWSHCPCPSGLVLFRKKKYGTVHGTRAGGTICFRIRLLCAGDYCSLHERQILYTCGLKLYLYVVVTKHCSIHARKLFLMSKFVCGSELLYSTLAIALCPSKNSCSPFSWKAAVQRTDNCNNSHCWLFSLTTHTNYHLCYTNLNVVFVNIFL